MLGGDDEALAGPVIHVVDHLVLGEGLDTLFHEEFDVSNLGAFFGFFRLIQSQPQAGSASAKPLKDDPNGLARAFLQQFLQRLAGALGDFHGDLLVGPFNITICEYKNDVNPGNFCSWNKKARLRKQPGQ